MLTAFTLGSVLGLFATLAWCVGRWLVEEVEG